MPSRAGQRFRSGDVKKLQVNGYADVDFNADELRAEDVAAVCRLGRHDTAIG